MVTMMLLLYVIHPIQINGYQPRQDFKQISAPQLKRANKNHTAIVPIPSDFCMNHHHHPISRRVVWDKVCASSTSSLSLLLGCSLFPASALGLSPKEAADSYDTYAANYDYLDAGKASNMLGIDDARTELFRQAKGNVLEIGAGTGLNLLKYDYDKISTLTLLDISDGMLNEARQRREQIISEVTYDKTRKSPQHDDDDDDNKNIKKKLTTIEFVTADATSQLVTKFNENTFDTVVDSFSLCVMGNDGARACLKEISKVVKPIQDGGKYCLGVLFFCTSFPCWGRHRRHDFVIVAKMSKLRRCRNVYEIYKNYILYTYSRSNSAARK